MSINTVTVMQAGWNSTLANEYLCKEEEEMVNQFDKAVKEMMENGWEEIVARQALLAQWSLDRRKALGKFMFPIGSSVLRVLIFCIS